MASRRPSGGEFPSGEEGADTVGDTFHQVAQGLLQEALRLQEQRSAPAAAAALREAVSQMEDKLQERDEAIRALREEFNARMQSVEEKMGVVYELFISSSTTERDSAIRGQVSTEQLEERMHNLETSVQRALEQVFPRVEALVAQLEEPSPPRASRAPPSPSATSCTSPSPQPVAASAAGATATGGAAAGAREEAVAGHQRTAVDDEETAQQRILRLIQEIKAKIDRDFLSGGGIV